MGSLLTAELWFETILRAQKWFTTGIAIQFSHPIYKRPEGFSLAPVGSPHDQPMTQHPCGDAARQPSPEDHDEGGSFSWRLADRRWSVKAVVIPRWLQRTRCAYVHAY